MNYSQRGSLIVLAVGLLFTPVAFSQTDTRTPAATSNQAPKTESVPKKAVESVKSGTKKVLNSAEQASDNLRNKVKRAIHKNDKDGGSTAQPVSTAGTSSRNESGCMKLSDPSMRQQCQGQLSK